MHEKQFGFRKNNYTGHAIVLLVNLKNQKGNNT